MGLTQWGVTEGGVHGGLKGGEEGQQLEVASPRLRGTQWERRTVGVLSDARKVPQESGCGLSLLWCQRVASGWEALLAEWYGPREHPEAGPASHLEQSWGPRWAGRG